MYAECAAVAGAGADAGWRRALSPARSREKRAEPGTARTGGEQALLQAAALLHRQHPRPLLPRTPAAATAAPSPTPSAAGREAAVPGTPTGPTALPLARHTAGKRHAETAATAPPGSLSPPRSSYYCVGLSRMAAEATVSSAALPT